MVPQVGEILLRSEVPQRIGVRHRILMPIGIADIRVDKETFLSLLSGPPQSFHQGVPRRHHPYQGVFAGLFGNNDGNLWQPPDGLRRHRRQCGGQLHRHRRRLELQEKGAHHRRQIHALVDHRHHPNTGHGLRSEEIEIESHGVACAAYSKSKPAASSSSKVRDKAWRTASWGSVAWDAWRTFMA